MADDSESMMEDALDAYLFPPESKPKEVKPNSLTFDTYEMIAGLLNTLEESGEDLLSYADESGVNELSGNSHTLMFDTDTGRWVVTAGR